MYQRLRPALLTAALASVALAGCGGSGADPGEEPTSVQPTSSTASTDPGGTTDPSASPSQAPANVQEAIDDLAQRLQVPAADIESGPLEPVTWSDGSLGCPSPTGSYPQVLTDGYRLVLTAGGQEYEYHAGEDGELAYCADPREPVSDGAEES